MISCYGARELIIKVLSYKLLQGYIGHILQYLLLHEHQTNIFFFQMSRYHPCTVVLFAETKCFLLTYMLHINSTLLHFYELARFSL